MDIRSITDKSDRQVSPENPPASSNGSHRVSNHDKEVAVTSERRGQVIEKDYTLNDTAALKKKIRNESRKEAFNLGIEARDGSNMVIEMKTSFFEHVKGNFINDMFQNKDIQSVENAIGVKAATENNGGAFVEYQVDISFKVQDKAHTVKLTAYTTTCRIMFQPVDENNQRYNHLGNKFVPRYFVDTFFLPWCEDAYSKKNYNEKALMEAVKNEVKRLDMMKMEAKKGNQTKTRLASIATTEARCVASGCKYTGLNSNNKSAVGVCAKCGGFEHFECSRTKQDEREEIQRGKLKYFCSICFGKNPSLIAFENRSIEGPKGTTAAIIQSTSSTRASLTTPVHIVPKIVIRCGSCAFETESADELTEHEGEKHKYQCGECDEEFSSNSLKEEHIRNKHRQQVHKCSTCERSYNSENEVENHVRECHSSDPGHKCCVCETEFDNQEALSTHMKSLHAMKCPLCTKEFTSNTLFSNHITEDHSPTCSGCDIRFNSKDELEAHIKECHTNTNPNKCACCEKTFQTMDDLTTHIGEEHIKCVSCEIIMKDQITLEKHIEDQHNIKCPHCPYKFRSQTEVDEHMVADHSIQCPMCPAKLKCTIEFTDHFRDCHIFSCEICEKELGSKNELERHLVEVHSIQCINC